MSVNHCRMSAMLWRALVLVLGNWSSQPHSCVLKPLSIEVVGWFCFLLNAFSTLFSLWLSFCSFTILQRGSIKESCVVNRAFILLASAPLVYLLSVAANAENLCLALSWALHMDIQTLFASVARTGHWCVHPSVVEPASILCVFKLASNRSLRILWAMTWA